MQDGAVKTIGEPGNARSRRTRAALLDATRSLLEEHGFESLTMGAVAERAGVSRRAVYLHFDSRAALVTALFEHVARTEGLQDSLRPIWQADDAVTALDEWARHLARYHPRVIAVDRAVERVRHTDRDAAQHWERVVEAQLSSCRRLATWLDHEDRLAPPWTVDSAADMLWALISTDMIQGLLRDRAWSRTRLAEHLGLLFRSTFTRDRRPGDPGGRGRATPLSHL